MGPHLATQKPHMNAAPSSVLAAVALMVIRTKKTGNITCPYGHDPTVKANAECEYAAFHNCLEEKYKASMSRYHGRGGGGRGGGGRGRGGGRGSSGLAVDYLKLSADDQKKTREQVLAAQASIDSPLVFMLPAKSVQGQVLATTKAPPCHILPIKIHSDFPHIVIQLGSILGGPNSPSIRAVINTAAALTTGNLHFFAKIAKAFPHMVAAMYALKDYAPITLSRIVEQNGASVTTWWLSNSNYHTSRRKGLPLLSWSQLAPTLPSTPSLASSSSSRPK